MNNNGYYPSQASKCTLVASLRGARFCCESGCGPCAVQLLSQVRDRAAACQSAPRFVRQPPDSSAARRVLAITLVMLVEVKLRCGLCAVQLLRC